jgi:hypothetical protein
MQSKVRNLIAAGVVVLIAAVLTGVFLVLSARWHASEADRAAKESESLRRAKSDIDATRAALDRSAEQAQERAQQLHEAIDSSKSYQEEQRAHATRTVGLANGMMSAAPLKVQMAEFFLTEGKYFLAGIRQ